MNHTLDLHGLREDLARDFLATIGLLRLLDLKWPLLNPKLCWLHETGHPRIQLNETLPPTGATNSLLTSNHSKLTPSPHCFTVKSSRPNTKHFATQCIKRFYSQNQATHSQPYPSSCLPPMADKCQTRKPA